MITFSFKTIQALNNRYTVIKSRLCRLMKITETFKSSNPGWLEYMTNKIDFLIVLKAI